LLIQGNISNRDTVPFKCDAPGTFWVRDNVTIPKTETLGAELLADGGFENAAGPSKWAGQKGAVLARVADHRPGSPGAHALNVTRGASYICALSDNIPLIEGKLYKLEVWLKRITDADTRPLALVAVAGGGAGQVRTWWDKPEELPVNTWKKHTAYFHPAATANYQVALWGGVNTGDQFRFDDVSLKEVINMPALGNIN
jgi:hypothetical protein